MTSASPDNVTSVVTPDDTSRIRQAFCIPTPIEIRSPTADERISDPPAGFFSCYLFMLEYGLTFPLSNFIEETLVTLQIPPARLCPRAWRLLITTERGWGLSNYPPLSLQEFFHCYKPTEGSGSLRGWALIIHRRHKPRLAEDTKSTEKNWKERFVFLSLTPQFTMRPSASIDWRPRLFLSHIVFPAANSFHRSRVNEVGTRPFRYRPPSQRFRLKPVRGHSRRPRREEGDVEPANFWDESELEYPSECVLLWLFNRSINPDPIATAIEIGLISRDARGKVTILKPHWQGICDRWERLIRDGRSYDDWSDQGTPPASPPIEEAVPEETHATPSAPADEEVPLRHQCRLSFSVDSRRLPSYVREVPAPLVRHPAWLGPVQYGASLFDFAGRPTGSGGDCWDQSSQVAGEMAHLLGSAAARWRATSSSVPEVAPFVSSVSTSAGEETRREVDNFTHLLNSVDCLRDATVRDREASTMLCRGVQARTRLLHDLDEHLGRNETELASLTAERDLLLSDYQVAISAAEARPNKSSRFLSAARKKLTAVLGHRAVDHLFP